MMTNSAELSQLRKKTCGELMTLALHAKLAGSRQQKISLCSIINAKSGNCSEDCRFCVQSAHYKTEAPVYSLVDKDTVLSAAQEAKDIGASHFSMVTSGRGLPHDDLLKVADIVADIRAKIDIAVCASLGILTRPDFGILKAAGLSRYHHNLETSVEFFPKIVSTHTFGERIDTIMAAKAEGLEVCAGGIFGLGETEDDRISMALALRECEVDSVPLNVLIPLPGTPLANQDHLPIVDILRAIALYRLILPDVPIRLAAGRETALADFLSTAFMAGADGMMIGGYLTEKGRQPGSDTRFAAEMQRIWRELSP
jgi:biotin synthase